MATSTLGSGTLVLAGTTSGTTTVTATAVAGTTTLTLPAATDTLVGKATTDTLTNKTLTAAKASTTFGVGAATPSGSGSGITFPATQSASSDANTLDDYEEGTWTATITNVVGTYTLTTVNYAQYTKIGQMVYGFLSVTVTTSGTASDSMNFTLPFVPAREGSGTGRENVSSGDILVSRIVTGGAGEGRLYKTSGAAAGAGTGTYVVSFMFLT